MNRIRLGLLAILLAGACLAAKDLGAQTVGRVAGVVTDESGGSLPGATATLTAARQGNAPRDTVTDARGAFAFDNLTPGPYALTVRLQGFTPRTINATVPEVGSLAPLKIVLRLDKVEEEVTVSARGSSAALAATGNAEQIELDQDALRRLPTDGQDILPVLANFLSPAASAQGV